MCLISEDPHLKDVYDGRWCNIPADLMFILAANRIHRPKLNSERRT